MESTETFWAAKASGKLWYESTFERACYRAEYLSLFGPNYSAKVLEGTETPGGDRYRTVARYSHGEIES